MFMSTCLCSWHNHNCFDPELNKHSIKLQFLLHYICIFFLKNSHHNLWCHHCFFCWTFDIKLPNYVHRIWILLCCIFIFYISDNPEGTQCFLNHFLMLTHASVVWNEVYLCNMFIDDMADCHQFQVIYFINMYCNLRASLIYIVQEFFEGFSGKSM